MSGPDRHGHIRLLEGFRHRASPEIAAHDETVWSGWQHQRLVCDFLTNRKMRVVIDGEESEAVLVDSGVPQGTVLGPLLFLCHINDLPDSVKSTVRLFADDCLLYRQIKSREDHISLQYDLQNLETWAKTWGMRFNAKKCYIMSINNKSTHFYQLDGHILQQVPVNPYLGVTISERLEVEFTHQ